ncbi:hypothetical protein QTP86_007132 [Hemibagrus guttatus]|nr:hypothetical protein QTP86_007132 [Hemibagrus guttatus]
MYECDNLEELDYLCKLIALQTDKWQLVRLGKHVSDSWNISTGSPQGYVFCPLLFSLYTNGCTSGHLSVKLLKFADDTTLIDLISDGDESAYRSEMDRLVLWCSMNNLELNSLKTVEITVDFRKDPAPLPPVILCDSSVTSVESFQGTTITQDLKQEQDISSLTKKAQQRMYFLRQLKKFLLPVKMLVNFYTAIIESIFTSSITVWFAAATARDKAKLQCVIHSAEKAIDCSLPSLQELYISGTQRCAAKITADPCHPGNELFHSFSSRKGYFSCKVTFCIRVKQEEVSSKNTKPGALSWQFGPPEKEFSQGTIQNGGYHPVGTQGSCEEGSTPAAMSRPCCNHQNMQAHPEEVLVAQSVEFVATCPVCAQNKEPRTCPQDLLHPLPIAKCSWSHEFHHWTTGFPRIWSLTDDYGLPPDFGKNLAASISLSSSFHPQTNGKMEKTNQETEKNLRLATVNHLSPPIPIFCILNTCSH